VGQNDLAPTRFSLPTVFARCFNIFVEDYTVVFLFVNLPSKYPVTE